MRLRSDAEPPERPEERISWFPLVLSTASRAAQPLSEASDAGETPTAWRFDLSLGRLNPRDSLYSLPYHSGAGLGTGPRVYGALLASACVGNTAEVLRQGMVLIVEERLPCAPGYISRVVRCDIGPSGRYANG